MYKLFLSQNSATMFVKCDTADNNMPLIPDIVSRKKACVKGIKIGCVKSNKNFNLYINRIQDYYKLNTPISIEEFFSAEEKHIFFTVDLDMEQMLNLQYILVMDNFFKKNNINYYLILNTDGFDSTYFKIYHYFNMRYEPIYNNIYIRTKDNNIKKLPRNDIGNYLPGEIIPYFNINNDFYKCCFSLFKPEEKILKDFNLKSKDLTNLLKEYYKDITNSELYLLRYIYSCLIKNKTKAQEIINFLDSRSNTPILTATLFISLLNRYNFTEYSTLYENCSDYALSLEQLIENSLFYAGNGILSMRIHQVNSIAMEKVCQKNSNYKYLLEISLIDFQENATERSIITQFLKYADANENEKKELQENLNENDGLKKLFELNYRGAENAVDRYFKKSNVIVQHYGLKTIGILAKKTKSLLVVRSRENFYTHNGTPELFLNQSKEQYGYFSGAFYRIIVPIKDERQELIYIGFSNNRYNCLDISTNYRYFYFNDRYIKIPTNREEKIDQIKEIKRELMSSIKSNHILVINTKEINNRLYLEYVVKAVLEVLYHYESLRIAMIGLRNNAYIKLALRFIQLGYNRYGKNEKFRENELFLCTEDCQTEILICGENYDDILKNIASQRVFGTFDDDLFEEMKLVLSGGR